MMHPVLLISIRYGYTRVMAFRPTGWVDGIARATHDHERLILYAAWCTCGL